ncbi:MAG: hypothetical protein K2O97_01505 [Acetatifactor sp.]|nr:hypothetical protein [Acetatifactor sp.]MDE7043689.1 hypothetical protein [Acetatifactor sp.]
MITTESWKEKTVWTFFHSIVPKISEDENTEALNRQEAMFGSVKRKRRGWQGNWKRISYLIKTVCRGRITDEIGQ